MTRPQPDTILSYCARIHLAARLGLAPDELDYIGMMAAKGFLLVLFNVMRPGPGYGSTRSVRVDL